MQTISSLSTNDDIVQTFPVTVLRVNLRDPYIKRAGINEVFYMMGAGSNF